MSFSNIICAFLGFLFFLIAIFAPINLAQIKIYLIASSIVLYGLPILKDAALGLTRFKVNGNLLFSIAILALIMINKLFEAAIYMGIISFGKILQEFIFIKFYTATHKNFQTTTTCQKIIEDKVVCCQIEALSPDDIILLEPNQICPVDAIIVDGQGEIEKSIVGFNINSNLAKQGDVMYAGSIAKDCTFKLKVLTQSKQSFLSSTFNSLVQSVKQVQIAEDENFSNYYAKRMLTFIVFMALPFFFFKVPILSWIEYSVIILLIFAPYNSITKASLILFVNCIKKACENGIIINQSVAMQEISCVKVVAIEKNIVLNKHKLIMSNIYAPYPYSRNQLLQLVCNLAGFANYPLEQTIAKYALEFSDIKTDASEVSIEENELYNIHGKVLGSDVILGTNAFLEKSGVKTSILLKKYSQYLANGCTVLFIAVNGNPAGLISFIDDISPTTFNIIRKIRSYGIKNVVLLDQVTNKLNKATVFADFFSNNNHASKVANIKRLHHRYGDVMLIGDVKTDLPSLNQADISVATNIIESSNQNNQVDISIITNNLNMVIEPFRLNYIYRKSINSYKKLYLFLKFILLMFVLLNYIYLWQALLFDTIISLSILLNSRFKAKL